MEHNLTKSLYAGGPTEKEPVQESGSSESEIVLEEEVSSQEQQERDVSSVEFQWDEEISESSEKEGSDSDEKHAKLDIWIEDNSEVVAEMGTQEISEKVRTSKIGMHDVQWKLYQNSLNRNSIIYLPTGTGKTRVAICSMFYYLSRWGTQKKIVFLANTVQLVKQQAEAIKETLVRLLEEKTFAKTLRSSLGEDYIELGWTRSDIGRHVSCIHGEKAEDELGMTKRRRIESHCTREFLKTMAESTIIVMISQMFLNSLRRGYASLTDFCFVVFDECHHCSGDHPYSGIMKEFYFDTKEKIAKHKRNDNIELPVLMGLTASPIPQPQNDPGRLRRKIEQLCTNLDSSFSPYDQPPRSQGTLIIIDEIRERAQKQDFPQLGEFLEKNSDHPTSYEKIRRYFPSYFECVQQIVQFLGQRHECLSKDSPQSKIVDPELFLFYDVKECLLVKLRDIWLQLGEFALVLAFHDMLKELGRISGMRSPSNITLLNSLKSMLATHEERLNSAYGQCIPAFMSQKVIRLIEILGPKEDSDLLFTQSKQKMDVREGMEARDAKRVHMDRKQLNDMCLVFAFKRRTVHYLHKVLKVYQQSQPEQLQKYYNSVAVTGYAGAKRAHKIPDEMVKYESDPSRQEDIHTILLRHGNFMEDLNQAQKPGEVTQNRNLDSEMSKLYNTKMGKLLLEIEERYNAQVNKIADFKRRKYRVLITTSVTEQGFDMSGCNLVVSFNMPFSLQSYIQIKGRARKEGSTYYIFTTPETHAKMEEHKHLYDDTIRATFQIAIREAADRLNQAADGFNQAARLEFKQDEGYEKARTKSGALLNNNYALQVLKAYFSSLRLPNKGFYQFIQTPSIAFRCIILFPDTSPSLQRFVIGWPFQTKEKALKSAAFQAVRLLKKEGLLKDDLRPSHAEELQDELDIRKFDDLQLIKRDPEYARIFEECVHIKTEQEEAGRRKFIRLYFSMLPPAELDFVALNREFRTHLSRFDKDPFEFQVYVVQFSNQFLLPHEEHEVGIMCSYQSNEQFDNMRRQFEENQNEAFTLKRTQSVRLLRADYERLKEVHLFLVAAEQGHELRYYSEHRQSLVAFANWANVLAKKPDRRYQYTDTTRVFYPLLVLLKQDKTNFVLNNELNDRILLHRDIMQRVYEFHNCAKQNPEDKFPLDLSQLVSQLAESDFKDLVVQAVSRDFCFQKGVILQREVIPEGAERKKLMKKQDKLLKTFPHAKAAGTGILVQMQLWRSFRKDKMMLFFNRPGGLKLEQSHVNRRLLKEFLPYPLCTHLLLKVFLAADYVFVALRNYNLALHFRDVYLLNLLRSRRKEAANEQAFELNIFPNIILSHADKIFLDLAKQARWSHLRKIGESYGTNITIADLSFELNVSGINKLQNHSLTQDKNIEQFIGQDSNHQFRKEKKDVNESVVGDQSVAGDQSAAGDETNAVNQGKQVSNNTLIDGGSKLKKEVANDSFNSSLLKATSKISSFELSYQEQAQSALQKDQNQTSLNEGLEVLHVLRSLTSRIYNRHKAENYEELQFIGDVVLKLLASMETFLSRPHAQEGEMHIRRAQIICNSNLHHKAIQARIFQYILASDRKIDLPPFRSAFPQAEPHEKFASTAILAFNSSTEDEGYQYIPGKIHADVVESLLGVTFLKKGRSQRSLQECQHLLYALRILNKPSLTIHFLRHSQQYRLPKLFSDFEQRISYRFKDKGLLVQAFTHPSFRGNIEESLKTFGRLASSLSSESSRLKLMSTSSDSIDAKSLVVQHQTFYERLQFLGDAVLDLVVVEHLYDNGMAEEHGHDEGVLTMLKQSVVSNKSLALIGLHLGLHHLILMDCKEIDHVMNEFEHIRVNLDLYMRNSVRIAELKLDALKLLSDVFEALVGAIFIDNDFNYNSSRDVVLGVMGNFIQRFTSSDFVTTSPIKLFKDFLDRNQYRRWSVEKDASIQMRDGKFTFLFKDGAGNVIDQCEAPEQKTALQLFQERQLCK